MYNLDKPGEWKGFVDICYAAAMTHPGGGRCSLPFSLSHTLTHTHSLSLAAMTLHQVNYGLIKFTLHSLNFRLDQERHPEPAEAPVLPVQRDHALAHGGRQHFRVHHPRPPRYHQRALGIGLQ